LTIQFSVLGDSHIGISGSEAIYKKILKQAVQNAHFIIHGGDTIDSSSNPDKQEKIRRFQLFNSITSHYPATYYYTIGNHDLFPHQGTSDLFRHYVASDFVSVVPLPNTRVQLVRLDNATGRFTQESLSLVAKLNPNDYYIFDFHWPLFAKNLVQPIFKFDSDKIAQSHAMTKENTKVFFKALQQSGIPRDQILGIFSHHAHKFIAKTCHFPFGYTNLPIYACGCAGAYACIQAGYYLVHLTKTRERYDLSVQPMIIAP